jgi:L-arabinose transport system permease protein
MNEVPMPLPSSPPSSGRGRAAWLFRLWDTSGMLLILIVMLLAASWKIPYFASAGNLVNLLLSVSTIALIACTMMLCLASGDFDLSVGSTLALGGMLCVLIVNAFPGRPVAGILLGILAGLAAGATVGFINGWLVARRSINALIASLGTQLIVRGSASILTEGRSVGVSAEEFGHLTNWSFPELGTFRGVPMPVWLMLVFFLIFGVLLNWTTFGRNALAVGGNKEAARLAGIAVDRTKIIIFTLQGLAAAFAGIVLSSRLVSADPKSGTGIELQAISACVLGGVSLTGGVATMSGVIVGLLIMGLVQNALNLLNVSFGPQMVVNGAILLAAVLLDNLKQRLRR